MNLNISATSSNMVQHLSNRVQHLSNIIQHLSNIFATFPNTIQMDYIWKTISATNRPYLIQTDFVGCKPALSDTNRLYRIQTDTSWSKLIQTDTITDYITNISFIGDFSYSRTKVPRTTTTYILLGPRCFATRGQK